MTDKQCPVSGCPAVIGVYSGSPACMQPYGGDPEAFRHSIRGCLFRSQAPARPATEYVAVPVAWLNELFDNDGRHGSKCWHAVKSYDVREKIRALLGGGKQGDERT